MAVTTRSEVTSLIRSRACSSRPSKPFSAMKRWMSSSAGVGAAWAVPASKAVARMSRVRMDRESKDVFARSQAKFRI